METMNYNRDNKKNSKMGIIGFILFACVGTAVSFYMIINEPEPAILGQDMYISTTSNNINEENNDLDIYAEEYAKNITYNVKNEVSKSTQGKFTSNISVPVLSINGEELEEINEIILNKFLDRYGAVKGEIKDLENKFTYKVTYNKYENNIDKNKILSFTFYERIIDDSKGIDVTYKLYAYSIDLIEKKLMTQDETALLILGSKYKNVIKDNIKEFVVAKKIFTEDNYSYSLTGLEEFYVKNNKLHIMFNPEEMSNNKDYFDITIND